MEKAIITSKQAKAIETFRENKWSDSSILYEWYKDGENSPPTKLHESIRKMSLDDLAKSLYVGYEVEKLKFKSGDWVVRIEEAHNAFGDEVAYEKGYTFEVVAVGDSYVISKDNTSHLMSSVRQATTEESFWAELGRGYRQIKWDDCLVLKNGEEFRVLSDRCEIYALAHIENNSVIGYYPAGSFKKFPQ